MGVDSHHPFFYLGAGDSSSGLGACPARTLHPVFSSPFPPFSPIPIPRLVYSGKGLCSASATYSPSHGPRSRGLKLAFRIHRLKAGDSEFLRGRCGFSEQAHSQAPAQESDYSPCPPEAVWEWGDHSITTPQPSHTIRGCEASDTVLNIVTKGNLEGKGFALSYIFIIEEN